MTRSGEHAQQLDVGFGGENEPIGRHRFVKGKKGHGLFSSLQVNKPVVAGLHLFQPLNGRIAQRRTEKAKLAVRFGAKSCIVSLNVFDNESLQSGRVTAGS